jgi:hypothetical protein
LNLAYICRWIEGEATILSPHEIDRVIWVTPKNIPEPIGYGHFRELMKKINDCS